MTEPGDSENIAAQEPLTDQSAEIDTYIQDPIEERVFEDAETKQEIFDRNSAKAESILLSAGADPNSVAFKTQAVILAHTFTDLEIAAVMDSTGIFNKTGFNMRLQEEADIAVRTDQPYVLASIDLNKLKEVNDDKIAGGHQAGDDQLESTATMLKRLSRKSDIVGRIGGDEFAVLLRTDMKGALAWGQRMIKMLGAAEIPVSIGVAVLDPRNLQQSWKTADQNMYKAKEASRAHGGGQYFDGTTTHLR